MVTAPARAEPEGAVETYGNYIGGDWRPAASGGTSENRSPADRDDLIGRFAASGREEVEAAVAAAAGAVAVAAPGPT